VVFEKAKFNNKFNKRKRNLQKNKKVFRELQKIYYIFDKIA